MFGRKVLWRSSSMYTFQDFFSIDNDIARFIESALHSPYSISFLAPPCLVFEILGINGLLSRMGEEYLSSFTSLLLINIRWWGPKVLLWFVLVGVSFTIPNEFFMFWGNYVSLIGATTFILLGLVLLVDFAHSWSETCLENWENSSSNFWQWVLIGSTAIMYAFTITLTGLLYAYFAGSGCTLNQFFISFNLALCIVITFMSVNPIVQASNPRSGLAQSSMVAAYCTYLIVSALSNHVHETQQCNPLRDGKTTRNSVIILGGIFTFLAIAYSTTRAATQSRALVGKGKKSRIQLPADEEIHVIDSQPGKIPSPRHQALLAAIEAGSVLRLGN